MVEKSKEEIELAIRGRGYPSKTEKNVLEIEGRTSNFEASVETAITKMAAMSQDEDDKKNDGKYFNGIEYVPIPKDLSMLERAMLKLRFVKQLFLENKRAFSEITELKLEISKNSKVKETAEVEEVVKPSIPTPFKLSDFVKARKRKREENFKNRAEEKKTSKENGQQGLVNRTSEENC